MMTKFYTGVGSRNTPDDLRAFMASIAMYLNQQGYILRSGGADGADTWFEQGAGNNKEIYLPWRLFNGHKSRKYNVTKDAQELARVYYYNGQIEIKKDSILNLMARNVQQVLGEHLDSRSEFVICWTKDGCIDWKNRTRETGGTGQAIEVASRNNIPVFNLRRVDHYNYWMAKVGGYVPEIDDKEEG